MKTYEQKQLEKLLKSKEYAAASIYTILFDLLKGNGVEEVVSTLHLVAFDLGKREELRKRI